MGRHGLITEEVPTAHVLLSLIVFIKVLMVVPFSHKLFHFHSPGCCWFGDSSLGMVPKWIGSMYEAVGR